MMKKIVTDTNILYEAKFIQRWNGKFKKPTRRASLNAFAVGLAFTALDIVEIVYNMRYAAAWYDWIWVGPITLAATAAFMKSTRLVKVQELDFIRVTEQELFFHCDPEIRHDSKLLKQVSHSLLRKDLIQQVAFDEVLRMERQLHDLVFFLKNGGKTKLHIWYLDKSLKQEVQDKLKSICETKGIPVIDSALFTRNREKQKLLYS